MLVRDVMTTHVRSVTSDTPIRDVARTLLANRIGGLPVVDDGKLVGIVTSSDLLDVRAATHARTAADVMTSAPITLTEDLPIVSAARMMSASGIKRAPVMRDDRVVGIVTRGDLLRPHLRTDPEIAAEIEDAILVRALDLSPRDIRVDVDRGIVVLAGLVADAKTRELIVRLTAAIDGVVDVTDDLAVAEPVGGQP